MYKLFLVFILLWNITLLQSKEQSSSDQKGFVNNSLGVCVAANDLTKVTNPTSGPSGGVDKNTVIVKVKRFPCPNNGNNKVNNPT